MLRYRVCATRPRENNESPRMKLTQSLTKYAYDVGCDVDRLSQSLTSKERERERERERKKDQIQIKAGDKRTSCCVCSCELLNFFYFLVSSLSLFKCSDGVET